MAADVTVIGAGLAGKATALHLAKAGLEVVCLEPDEPVRPPLGESLDWSAPDLLKALGMPMERLVGSEMATWKRHVVLKMRDGSTADYDPSPWLGKAPFHIELRTMHVDRVRLDQELMKLAIEGGVTVIRDKALRVERNKRTIDAVVTASGARFSSPWFVDASGFATHLLAREFELRALTQGPAKVAMWTYFPVTDAIEGTTLYMDPLPGKYLEWIWEIPVNPETVSVGCVASGAAVKAKREQGLSVEDIFRGQLSMFPRFDSLSQGNSPAPLNVTSFRSRVYLGVAGPNWLIAGEAASMVDPMTANGLTAALRHAAEGSALILKYRNRGRLPMRARVAYSFRMAQVASFFNGGIEKIIYEPQVRGRIGMGQSGTAYTSPAWSMNVVYARLKPKGLLSTGVYCLALGAFRAGAWAFYGYCKWRTHSTEAPS